MVNRSLLLQDVSYTGRQILDGYILRMKQAQGGDKTRDGATGSKSSDHQVSSHNMVEQGRKRAKNTRGKIQR
jgi:hypothetical protein